MYIYVDNKTPVQKVEDTARALSDIWLYKIVLSSINEQICHVLGDSNQCKTTVKILL